jgi:hypothetical protein
MPSCSRSASEYVECPVIKYPGDRATFIKQFLETPPEDRAIQLGGHAKRKDLLKAKDEKGAGKIHDALIELERKRYLDFERDGYKG